MAALGPMARRTFPEFCLTLCTCCPPSDGDRYIYETPDFLSPESISLTTSSNYNKMSVTERTYIMIKVRSTHIAMNDGD
jgi:hypothetical protein